MPFVSRLRPELISVAPPWRTFDETIVGLIGLLTGHGALPPSDQEAARLALAAREAEASTALLDIGVGVPHARLVGLLQPAVALALSVDGLYQPVAGVHIRIVVLVLSPPAATTDHLQILASASTLLRSMPLRTALLEARDAATVMAALARHARPQP